MTNSGSATVSLFGRILLSAIFILSGFSKLFMFHSIAGMLSGKGFPLATLAAAVAIAIELLGGLAILAGFHAKLTAWIVFLYLIPTTLTFHNFWTMQGMMRMDNQIHFLKNLAIMGGLLLLASNGAGRYSLDASSDRGSISGQAARATEAP
ncbi:MAG TPA: DoxX family protein [Candidatus Acidoferrum sp.]|nr:DoxX family protein [Candidatus Acidoferrum sp.]